MTVPVPTLEDVTFAQRRDQLCTAVGTGDAEAQSRILRELIELGAGAVAGRDVATIAELRAQVARLVRRLAGDFESEAASRALVELKVLDIVLDSGRTAALLHAAAEGREKAAGPLRERIVAQLATGTTRPRDLAVALRCDPSQISRALRELQASGVVERVMADAGLGDRRAAGYQLVAGVPAASGAAAPVPTG